MTAPGPLVVNDRIAIPRAELRYTFVRSSGPGGQNVNKVNSKAVLRWSVRDTAALAEQLRRRFMARFAGRINDAGELLISSQRYRDQARNIRDCEVKLRELILSVATPVTPRKTTRIPWQVNESRLRQKRAAADKKRLRRHPPSHES